MGYIGIHIKARSYVSLALLVAALGCALGWLLGRLLGLSLAGFSALGALGALGAKRIHVS